MEEEIKAPHPRDVCAFYSSLLFLSAIIKGAHENRHVQIPYWCVVQEEFFMDIRCLKILRGKLHLKRDNRLP